MGFLKRAIQNGIQKGVGDAIGNAVRQVIEPTATDLANKAADSIDQAAKQTEGSVRRSSGFDDAMANLKRSAESYATEAAKNIKVCPSCSQPCSADKKFCENCGAKLPETTVAQASVCSACGKQNTVGTKFCCDCGAKLPATVQEERAEDARGKEVLSKWDELLSAYPKWSCGGLPADIQDIDTNSYIFIVDFKGDSHAAGRAVEQYRQLAVQNGFRQAGEYPNIEHLYKKADGICYHIDTEHCFDGDADCPGIGFDIREPVGGYDEPKKKTSIFDLFK